MTERYSIEVNDDSVIIYGDLTIEETFDFLNFYERKGFTCVCVGIENSTLCMFKKNFAKDEIETEQKKLDEKNEFEESYYCQSLYEENIRLKKINKELEDLIRGIMPVNKIAKSIMDTKDGLATSSSN